MTRMRAHLSRSMALSGAAVAAAAGLAACGTSTGSAASPSATAAAGSAATSPTAAMGGVIGSGPSASESAMGGAMGSAPSESATGGMMGAAGGGKPAAGPHDAADVTFVMGMVPHHSQAIAMADLAPTRATSPGVKALAVAVKAAQGPEITEMTGWLRGWGAPMSGGAMGGMGMTGTMSATEMADLAKLTGTAFDTAWLTMMSTHHRGAVAMARTELSAGENADAKTLARSIITSQTAQLTQMKALLAHLPTP